MYEMDTLNGHCGSNQALSQVRMFDMQDTLVSRVARDSSMEASASSKGFESYASFMMPFSRLPRVPPMLQDYNMTASSTLAPERTSEGSLYRTKRHWRMLQKRDCKLCHNLLACTIHLQRA